MALNNSEIAEEQLQQLETIKINHDEAYLYVSQALSYQEQHQYSPARDMYEKSLEKMHKALNVRCDRSYCHGPEWNEAFKLQQKMRMKTQMIKSQLRDIQNYLDAPPTSNGASTIQFIPPESSELPPTYNEACEYDLIAVSRQSSSSSSVSSENGLQMNNSEVVELFSIQEDVMMFYISNDGSVSTPSAQSPLYIYQFVEHDAVANYVPPAWLQIGKSWTYPFIPGQSPVLESAYGAFMFPNAVLGEGSAVGVILPPTVDVTERAQFLAILNSLTAFKGEGKNVSLPSEYESSASKTQTESFSDTLSRGIVTGAEYLSDSIVKGAALSSDRIHKEASKSRQKINLEAKHVYVDPHVQKGSKMAQEASDVALKATGFLVKKLGDLTLALGKQLAPHIKEQGSKFLSTAFNKDKADANETMDGVLTVTAGGLQGISTVFSGLESAARTLAYCLSQETVNVVGYKYGTEAAEVVENALFAVGNLALTTRCIQSLGVNAIAKKTAKDTGKAVVTEYIKNENHDSETKTIDDDEKLPKK